MIAAIIRWSIRNRLLVIVAAIALSWAGWRAMLATPLDAIPDLSDVQVIVKTSYPGQAANLVEDQITYPLANQLLAVPGATQVRGYSFFGDSYLYVIFADGTDPYWARSRVLEILNQAQAQLPEGITPSLGPDASGVGWIYEYALVDRSGQHHLGELTSLQNWSIKQALQGLPGVAEVATVGGMVQAYQVVIDPQKLRQYGIPLSQVKQLLATSNQDVGGGIVEMAEAEYMVRASGYISSLEQLRELPLPVNSAQGTALTLADIATVRRGPLSRRGMAELNGEGEVVGGIVVMRYGANALNTIQALKTQLQHIQQSLPAGVELVTTYDRSQLIQSAVDNLQQKIIEEMALVALVCVLFLWHARSALVAIITLPLAVLTAFIVMRWLGVSANIMSLGGIAIALGTLVDAAIVLIENAHKHLLRYQQQQQRVARGAERWRLITQASIEVGPAVCLSLLIITISFLPVFALQAQEGRLFTPLAYTKSFAMAAAALFAVTLIPVLMGLVVRGRVADEQRNWLVRGLTALYRPLLQAALSWPKTTLLLALLISASAYWPWQHLDTEFMPPMVEGDLLYMPTTLPGVSPQTAVKLLQKSDQLIKQVAEVKTVFGKVGRADTATDPAPLTMLETTIQLRPKDEWRAGIELADIIAELDAKVQIPGIRNAWVQPIKTRIDMLSTGVKSSLAIKLSGDSLAQLQQVATQFEQHLQGYPETASVYAERATMGRYLDITPDLNKAAQYGLDQSQIQQAVRWAIGGETVTTTVEGRERYPIIMRYPRQLRDHLASLRQLPIVSQNGQWVMLGDIADIAVNSGATLIKSENAQPVTYVYIEPQADMTVAAYQELVQHRLAQIAPSSGVRWQWAGQYQYLQRVSSDLQQLLPLILLSIVMLLYAIFRSLTQSLMVLLSLPLALAGSLWFISLLDFHLSLAVAVGLIALAGIAAEFGVVMMVYLNNAWQETRERNLSGLKAAVMRGAVARLRPKVMTVLTVVLGLLPILIGGATADDVMQRIAAPVVGGMILAPLVSMLVIPVLFYWQQARRLRHR
ncbi:efflux RND transporter permease subunit [Idiomarina xiamenensis]|uniref:Co/Zn/Cd efflux system membrane protein n=1 Tax=Idiomarina xiamenensis 10-D-4 TaxID=740709 RepID=K2KSE7_9GAMM|nr:CusA/CzcA family heavy metal efflux RND transporter [Idiomarina xiamenensis]EKE85304.1 Co/Zn/Cd efflux system membrane protein [Idiomarina xiamenensis 10-D-4]